LHSLSYASGEEAEVEESPDSRREECQIAKRLLNYSTARTVLVLLFIDFIENMQKFTLNA
jgi:hypothetical protein